MKLSENDGIFCLQTMKIAQRKTPRHQIKGSKEAKDNGMKGVKGREKTLYATSLQEELSGL